LDSALPSPERPEAQTRAFYAATVARILADHLHTKVGTLATPPLGVHAAPEPEQQRRPQAGGLATGPEPLHGHGHGRKLPLACRRVVDQRHQPARRGGGAAGAGRVPNKEHSSRADKTFFIRRPRRKAVRILKLISVNIIPPYSSLYGIWSLYILKIYPKNRTR
jgi:hypothetical protein